MESYNVELLYLSLSITFVRSCLTAYFLFYGWIMFHCTGMPHFVYPFILWRTFWVVSVFWLLWIVSWTLMFTFLFEYLCSVLEGIHLEVELMGLTFGGAAKLLSIMVGIFYSLTSNAGGFQLLQIHAHTCYCLFTSCWCEGECHCGSDLNIPKYQSPQMCR